MKKYIYISLLAIISLMYSCIKDDFNTNIELDADSTVVELLDDGRIKVTGSLSGLDMTDVSVTSRAENSIYTGWCMVFGEDDASAQNEEAVYSDSSPLLQKLPLTINANGTFFVVFDPSNVVSFMRIVVNLTARETEYLEAAKDWASCGADGVYTTDDDGVVWLTRPDIDQVSDNKIGTFGEYRLSSVGLDGIYNIDGGYSTTVSSTNLDSDEVEYASINTTQPDPTNVASSFPMSSIGFVLSEGITEDSMEAMFGSKIYMVRTCSKVDITVNDADFTIKKVYMIDCAQESRLRSTVLSTSSDDGATVSTSYSIPQDLGGAIDYLPLEEEVSYGGTTSPIYIYPNKGGEYDYNDGVVNHDVNPQYVIIKGRAAGYSSDGYYKVALKAQYPFLYEYKDDGTLATDKDGKYIVLEYSDLTYDIIRNTHFNIDLLVVDKPGYLTLEDAKDPNNPACNISYNITITSSDGRNEILVSNGTYYAELETSRVYMMGYGEEGFQNADITFSLTPGDSNSTPATYIKGDYGVEVTGCTVDGESVGTDTIDGEIWYKIDSSTDGIDVKVTYDVTYSGRICIYAGDMLKYIPVEYEADYVTYANLTYNPTKDLIDHSASTDLKDTFGVSFAYEGATFDSGYDGGIFKEDGSVVFNESYEDVKEVRVQFYPQQADGIAKLYFKQSPKADIELVDVGGADKYFIYTPKGMGAFSNIVNGYDNLYDAVVNRRITFDNERKLTTDSELVNSVDLTSICYSGNNWTPIGNFSYRYAADFDGNDNTVSNIYIDTSSDYQGLFGYSGGEIKNVTVDGSVTSSSNYIGGVTGYSSYLVTNCHNEVNVKNTSSSAFNAGGVVGAMSGSGTISGCSNSGEVSCSGYQVGGIVGHLYYSTVEGSYNTGAVYSSGAQVGGVAGRMTGGTMSGCYNNYNAYSLSTYVGGVVGYMAEGGAMTGCYNNTTGTAGGLSGYIGGVVGYMETGGTLTGCYNNGSVSTPNAYIGGVVGYIADAASTTASTIDQCYNSGSVTSTIPAAYNSGSTTLYSPLASYTGGVVGYSGTYNKITNCSSTEDAQVASTGNYVGGIVGNLIANATIDSCVNRGDVTGTENNGDLTTNSGTWIGGVVGRAETYTTISNCSNYGAMLARNYHSGGIVGYVNRYATMSNCTNYGEVSSTFFEVGGVAGITYDCTLTNCVNEGYVHPASGHTYGGRTIGGVIGYMYEGTEMYNCANKGTVEGVGTYQTYYNPYTGTTTSNRGVGGLVGYCYSQYARIENCYNTGTIEATGSNAGGIIGHMSSSDPANNNSSSVPVSDSRSYIYGVYNTGTISAPNYAGGIIGSIDYSVNGTTNHYTYATIASLYNRGTVTSSGTYCDPIVSYTYSTYSTYVSMTGAYYLSGTASKTYYTTLSTSRNEAQMTYNNLVSTLNNYHAGSSSYRWAQDYTGINSYFPIFSWQ
ncbi:MAG: GLUG motif-containing protein [Rikenellaceae bacterium]